MVYYYYHAESDCYIASITSPDKMEQQLDEISKETFIENIDESRENIDWTCKGCKEHQCSCWSTVQEFYSDIDY